MMKLSLQEFSQRAARLAAVSADYSYSFSKCATEKQVNWRQKQVTRPIPEGIKGFALQVASRVELHWKFRPEIADLESFNEDFPTSGEFEFNFFETDLNKLDGWEHSFTHWQDYREAPNPFDFNELFPVFAMMNGDLIVELIGEREKGAIYYLDHECGSGDWKRLADSYDGFLSTLSTLWFPDLEWHDSLDQFYDHDLNRLSVETPFAKRWIAFMEEQVSKTSY
jgi:hypothetical protein